MLQNGSSLGNWFLRIQFTMLSHWTIRSFRNHQQDAKGLLLFKLVSDLGIIHMVLVLCICRRQELWSQEGFHQDTRKRLWEARHFAPERVVCEAMSVNPEVQYEDSRSTESLRRTTRSDQRQFKTKTLRAIITSGATEVNMMTWYHVVVLVYIALITNEIYPWNRQESIKLTILSFL